MTKWIRARLPKRLRTYLQDWKARELGAPSMRWSLENLSGNGFRPVTTIDVGAFVGDWTEMALPIFPQSRFLMVEAQEANEDKLRAVCARHPGVGLAVCVVGQENQAAVPFALMEMGSSLYPERTPFPRTWVQVPMRRLDDVVAEHGFNGPFFLKLDVQGAELDVMLGAPDTLAQTDVLLAETSFLPYNEGAPLFLEVANFLDSAGFAPYDVCGVARRKSDRTLFQADFIFVRKAHPLRDDRPSW